ncbi:hypothetical protein [Mucilaginibacter sp.]
MNKKNYKKVKKSFNKKSKIISGLFSKPYSIPFVYACTWMFDLILCKQLKMPVTNSTPGVGNCVLYIVTVVISTCLAISLLYIFYYFTHRFRWKAGVISLALSVGLFNLTMFMLHPAMNRNDFRTTSLLAFFTWVAFAQLAFQLHDLPKQVKVILELPRKRFILFLMICAVIVSAAWGLGSGVFARRWVSFVYLPSERLLDGAAG